MPTKIMGASSDYPKDRILSDARHSNEPIIVVNMDHGTVEQFQEDLRAAEGVIADFDGTLTSGNQWGPLMNLLDPKDAARNYADFQKCLRPGATFLDEARQLLRSVQDLSEARMTRCHVDEIASEIVLRDSAIDLLRTFHRSRREVISWGIADVIERCLCVRHDTRLHVNALRLRWAVSRFLAEDGVQFERGTLVTNKNKGVVREEATRAMGLDPGEVLVLADGPTDIEMISSDYLTVTIFPSDDDRKRQAWREKGLYTLFDRSRAMVFGNSWKYLVDLRTASS